MKRAPKVISLQYLENLVKIAEEKDEMKKSFNILKKDER